MIKAYAKREAPLRDLLKIVPLPAQYNKTARAFLDLKVAVTSRPVVLGPRYDGSPFVLTTDGCAEGFAAVLSQKVRTQTPEGRWVEKLHPS